EAVGVRLVSGIEHHLALSQNRLGLAEMDHGRRQQGDARMAVLYVVRLEELLAVTKDLDQTLIDQHLAALRSALAPWSRAKDVIASGVLAANEIRSLLSG